MRFHRVVFELSHWAAWMKLISTIRVYVFHLWCLFQWVSFSVLPPPILILESIFFHNPTPHSRKGLRPACTVLTVEICKSAIGLSFRRGDHPLKVETGFFLTTWAPSNPALYAVLVWVPPKTGCRTGPRRLSHKLCVVSTAVVIFIHIRRRTTHSFMLHRAWFAQKWGRLSLLWHRGWATYSGCCETIGSKWAWHSGTGGQFGHRSKCLCND